MMRRGWAWSGECR
uniref:Uncharacterized protein n=1 Tax=Arundo donax TaxID=35708 RepID=A0A0A9EHW6_ARUDO